MNKPLVLFVCTGNICRSPMAAALLRSYAEARGDALQVESAGTWGVEGEPASPLAQRVISERGLSLDGHIARTVSRELLQSAAVLIVMTRSHRDALAAEFPETRPKLYMMSELSGMQYDIADPYGRPLAAYEACATNLEQLIQLGYERLQEWVSTSPQRILNI